MCNFYVYFFTLILFEVSQPLNLYFIVFLQIWGVFSHYFFGYFFSPTFSSFGTQKLWIFILFHCLEVPEDLLFFQLILCLY